MRSFSAGLRASLVAGVIVLQLAAPVEASTHHADSELHVGDQHLPRAFQKGALVYYGDVLGDEMDNSAPPIRWPRPVDVGADELVEVSVHGAGSPPTTVEFTAWRSIRRDGIPRRESRIWHSECFATPLEPCGGRPDLSSNKQPAWAFPVEIPVARGPVYIAANFTWDASHVRHAVWLFHARLRR
ncbi:MAG TPA: hypothetical protein VM784_14760 [Actinomycetota bacterium]|nr:hypothetical protein [Actinomycetota bacterium]